MGLVCINNRTGASMKIHKPIFYTSNLGNIVYEKTETDDNFIHRNTGTISLNVKNLERCDIVFIKLIHLEAEIYLKKSDCILYGHYMSFISKQTGKQELKLYVPLDRWKIVKGSKKWNQSVKNAESSNRATGTMKTKVYGAVDAVTRKMNIKSKKF